MRGECKTAWLTIFVFMKGESKTQEPHLVFMPARLGPPARLGLLAGLRPPARLGRPARPRPLDCDGPCSFGGAIESCSPHLEFGCSCDSPRRCGFLWSFSFCSALRRYLVSYPRIIDHLPSICLDHGVKREAAMGRQCGFGGKTRTQNTGQGRAPSVLPRWHPKAINARVTRLLMRTIAAATFVLAIAAPLFLPKQAWAADDVALLAMRTLANRRSDILAQTPLSVTGPLVRTGTASMVPMLAVTVCIALIACILMAIWRRGKH